MTTRRRLLARLIKGVAPLMSVSALVALADMLRPRRAGACSSYTSIALCTHRFCSTCWGCGSPQWGGYCTGYAPKPAGVVCTSSTCNPT
jgi:hypothetical protein